MQTVAGGGGLSQAVAYVYLPPDAPSCDRDRRRGIAVWGVSGYARGGAYVYLPPDAPHATGTGGEGLFLGCVGGMPEEGESRDG